jgi:hypothetical protein
MGSLSVLTLAGKGWGMASACTPARFALLALVLQAQAKPRGWNEGATPQAIAGLSAVYAALIQPKLQLRVDFLRGLLKRLRTGACLVSSGAAEADLRLLAFCAALLAGLPYKRGDEPCLVVQVGDFLCRRANLLPGGFIERPAASKMFWHQPL